MVDPPWRFDPFQNMKTVHWGTTGPGFLVISIFVEIRVVEHAAKSWAIKIKTPHGDGDFYSGTTPANVTASSLFYERIFPGMDIGRSCRSFTADLSQFKPDESTFKVEIPPEPPADGGQPMSVPKTYYVVWLNEDNGSTPNSPSEPIESGMSITNFLVNGALDFGAVMAATAPDGTSGSRFIYAKTFPARVPTAGDPWTKSGWQFDGERAVFDDPDVADAVAASSIAYVDAQGNEGPPSYHVETIKYMAAYPAGVSGSGPGEFFIIGTVRFAFQTYKHQADIVLDNHNWPTSKGVGGFEWTVATWGNTITVQIMASVSRGKLNIAPPSDIGKPPTVPPPPP